MDRSKNYSLLLLAGGKSSRMGKNKAELVYEGQTFVDTLISKAKKLGITQIYLSGQTEKQEQAQIVWDIYPERGPLGGIHACMKEMTTPFCLVLPVDVPQIPVSVLEELIVCHEQNHVNSVGKELPLILQHGNRKEHLIGIYSVTMVDFIEDMIKEHSASVHRMLEMYGHECYHMDVPTWQVANINTLDDYKDLLTNEQNV